MGNQCQFIEKQLKHKGFQATYKTWIFATRLQEKRDLKTLAAAVVAAVAATVAAVAATVAAAAGATWEILMRGKNKIYVFSFEAELKHKSFLLLSAAADI